MKGGYVILDLSMYNLFQLMAGVEIPGIFNKLSTAWKPVLLKTNNGISFAALNRVNETTYEIYGIAQTGVVVGRVIQEDIVTILVD